VKSQSTGKRLHAVVLVEFDRRSMMDQYARGDSRALVEWLRGREPISPEIRSFLTKIVDGSIVVKRRRGIKSRISRTHAGQAREAAKRLFEKDGFSKAQIKEALAKAFNVSEATIRDMLAKRKTFAEK
jgi:hypothetical protein